MKQISLDPFGLKASTLGVVWDTQIVNLLGGPSPWTIGDIGAILRAKCEYNSDRANYNKLIYNKADMQVIFIVQPMFPLNVFGAGYDPAKALDLPVSMQQTGGLRYQAGPANYLFIAFTDPTCVMQEWELCGYRLQCDDGSGLVFLIVSNSMAIPSGDTLNAAWIRKFSYQGQTLTYPAISNTTSGRANIGEIGYIPVSQFHYLVFSSKSTGIDGYISGHIEGVCRATQAELNGHECIWENGQVLKRGDRLLLPPNILYFLSRED